MCSYGGQVVVVAHGDICHAGGLTAWLGQWDGNFATSDKGERGKLGEHLCFTVLAR